MANLVSPSQIPLNRNVIATHKGTWLLRVDSVLTGDEADCLALHLRLQSFTENQSRTRRLYAVVRESDLDIPQERVIIADHIRRWIETSEGDGFLAIGRT